jgi:hypothetical protein
VRNRVEAQVFSSLRQFRRAIPPREIARLCGPPFTEIDIFEVGDEMGLTGSYSRYRQLEASLIVAKLIVRASEPEIIQRLLGAYARLSGRGENDALA